MIKDWTHPRILKIGKPTHFRPTDMRVSACGIEYPDFLAYDGRDVTCLNCRRTKAWKAYMGKAKKP